ncbi:hypothetical protein MA16_Dca014417 [Dendrobium catenatum]|uniref:Uncharacterized protein n=1 Tax=Dendrobium catenatum TaxID=906689 RepID=A0A2I0WWN0_9ASPA|nr:hypothetical protein MA16_Dca014417 [Dendrobium catenatum]
MVRKNLNSNFEIDVMTNGVVPKNKEELVSKDNFTSEWKKTQHIKLNYNMENTQMKEDGMAENQVVTGNLEELHEVNENQCDNRMLGDTKLIKEHKNSNICVYNKFQILMDEQEEGEVVEVAEAKDLNRVEDTFEIVSILELIQYSSFEKVRNTGDQTVNSRTNKLSKEVRSLGLVEATHRKRKGDNKGCKKVGDFSPPGH